MEAAQRILQDEVYVHQFKVNAKLAFRGEVWEWHQDYIFWRNEDGMPTDNVVTLALFLDEVNEFNGPLLFVPGSHKLDILPHRPIGEHSAAHSAPVARSTNGRMRPSPTRRAAIRSDG